MSPRLCPSLPLVCGWEQMYTLFPCQRPTTAGIDQDGATTPPPHAGTAPRPTPPPLPTPARVVGAHGPLPAHPPPHTDGLHRAAAARSRPRPGPGRGLSHHHRYGHAGARPHRVTRDTADGSAAVTRSRPTTPSSTHRTRWMSCWPPSGIGLILEPLPPCRLLGCWSASSGQPLGD